MCLYQCENNCIILYVLYYSYFSSLFHIRHRRICLIAVQLVLNSVFICIQHPYLWWKEKKKFWQWLFLCSHWQITCRKDLNISTCSWRGGILTRANGAPPFKQIYDVCTLFILSAGRGMMRHGVVSHATLIVVKQGNIDIVLLVKFISPQMTIL